MGAMFRRTVPLIGALLVLFAVATPQASAATVTLAADDVTPAVGNPVTYTANINGDCAPTSLTFAVDGVAQPAQATNTLTTTWTTTGSHTVSVTAVVCDEPIEDTDTVTVVAAPSGNITISPDPPRPGQTVTIALVHTNGRSPYTDYRWTIDGVADPAGNDKRTWTRALAAGTRKIEVTFLDTGDPDVDQPAHKGTVTRTVTVAEPPAPPPGSPPPPPPPPPPPCEKVLAFELSEFKTDGCFTKVSASPEQWATSDRVRLNGVAFADTGQRFVITFPTAADPGGRVKTDNSAIQLDRFVPFSGAVDWALPAGKAGEIRPLREVAVPATAALFKLRIAGSAVINLGREASGKRYATFTFNIALPPAFTAGPTRFSGGVSGATSLRVDDDGVRYDGLKVAVKDVWVGRLKIVEACFSYIPANGLAVVPCKAPELDGRPYLECADDATTDRWDGNAVVELPTASATRLAAFGGLANGRVSKLGGYVDGLGTTVPIVPGVFLNRVGIGLCLAPPPLKLRGDVGVTALGGQLDVNGRVTYTDATDSAPWRVDVGGNVKVSGTQLGDASVGFNAWGDVDFGVNTKIDLGPAELTGGVNGWIEPRNSAFNVSGTIRGCIDGLPCAQASALISNVGIAGCLDLGTYTIRLPDKVVEGPTGFGSLTIITRTRTFTLRGGFGYRYRGNVSLLGNSCDFAPYTSARSAQAGAGPLTTQIAAGTRAVALRIEGTDGPPKVVLRGPGGTTITSPATGTGAQRRGRFVLAENPSDGTTSVLLIKPAAGTWRVTAASGASSRPRRVQRSAFQAPPVLFGQTRRSSRGQEVAVQYAVPAGASVRLVERGAGISQIVARSVRGTRCRGAARLPDGRTLRCARIRFQPSRGPGGTRRVEALVTRAGIPLARKAITTFRVRRETRPATPGALTAIRQPGALVVAFPAARGASRYTATAVLTDGRTLGLDLEAGCRAFRITGVGAGVGAAIKVAGVRYDLAVGAYRRISVAPSQARSGPRRTLPRRICT